jgi:myo-inositol-1(or 4)-monophosphatase
MSEIDIAIQAALTAGQMLCKNLSNTHEIHFKGVIDMVTEMDCASERMLLEILKSAYPQYGFMGEEGSRAGEAESGCWIVDPVDGTTNYSRGYPLFSVSIALQKLSEIVLGVVFNPVSNELFVAEKGSGASLNGKPIHVNTCTSLAQSLLASGFPYDVWSSPVNNFREWSEFMRRTISVRCDGSASLDLCHVAMGRVDGYWELDLEAWDMAAGALIVEEAGGMVTHVSGEPFSILGRNVLASNGHLHRAMLEILNSPAQE